jgi:hypothetical protein
MKQQINIHLKDTAKANYIYDDVKQEQKTYYIVVMNAHINHSIKATIQDI